MAEDRRIRWGFGTFFLAWTGVFMTQVAVGAMVLGARGGGIDYEPDAFDITVITVAAAAMAYLVARLVAQVQGGGSARWDFGLVIRARDWRWFLVGIGMQVLATISVWVITEIAGSSPDQGVVRAIQDSPLGWRIVAGLAVALAAPLSEELLFRGILLRSALRRMSAVAAVGLSAAIFAVAHLMDPETAVLLAPLALVGVVCGIRAVRSGELSQPILVHAGFNAVTATLLIAAA